MESHHKSPVDSNNIPYMQLFLHLKHKFADLKDCDINESIQKYGLDQTRCEEELQQKTLAHTGGYYGPWGRSHYRSPSLNPSSTPSPSSHTLGIANHPIVTATTPTTTDSQHNTSTAAQIFLKTYQSQTQEWPSSGQTLVPISLSSAARYRAYPMSQLSRAQVPYTASTPMHSLQYGWNTAVTNTVIGIRSQRPRQDHGHANMQNGPSPPAQLSSNPPSRSSTPAQSPILTNFDPLIAFKNSTNQCTNRNDQRREFTDTLPHKQYKHTTLNTTLLGGTTTTLTTSPCLLACTTTTTSAGLYNSDEGRLSCHFQQAVGKHTASLHFIPALPGAVDSPVCDASGKGLIEFSGRSYTSVNLQLRQPSQNPQPAINIGTNRSSLTYSTSSIDQKHGSRSSLQISIGPTGGSISAMRTQLDSKHSDGSTALHIEYSNERSTSPNSSHFPLRNDISVLHSDRLSSNFKNERDRPQSWYVPSHWQGEKLPIHSSNLRRNSLPETSMQSFVDSKISGGGEEGKDRVLVRDAANVKALVEEQRTRREKLQVALELGLQEKDEIQKQLDTLQTKLGENETKRQQYSAACAQKIDELQQINRRLQSECDQMEAEILHAGEVPITEQVEANSPSNQVVPQLHNDISAPGSQLPSRTRSTTNSGGDQWTPQGHSPSDLLTPVRPAPPVPTCSASSSMLNHNTQQRTYQDVSRVADASNEEQGLRWSCSRCTYDNHPAMDTCEICGSVRLPLGQTQDIHIQVRHQNFSPRSSASSYDWAVA